MDLKVTIRQDGAQYWSEIAELPGCFASGRTLGELTEALSEAVGLDLGDEPIALGGQPLRVGTVKVELD